MIVRSNVARLRLWFLGLFMAACARPEVDVPRELGERGEFCVTATDCEPGLSCLERRCCGGTACASTCDQLLASGGQIAAEIGRQSGHERVLTRGHCLSLCCAGRTPPEITRALAPHGDGR